jgi:DNA-binding transcriptional ArsR family regulator
MVAWGVDETILSSVIFRNVSSEELEVTTAGRATPDSGMPHHKLTDARAMRALAHPVRLALLEALVHAGTLTATQASDLLGESPANCAFHLRTLAKYGYVVEAGGGKGRERPWRRAHTTLQITTDQDDPSAASAADELSQWWLSAILDRARSAHNARATWPAEWQHSELTGQSEMIVYATPAEADQLAADIERVYRRFHDRLDHPERRPDGAMPIEILVFAYPLLHLAARPAAADPD